MMTRHPVQAEADRPLDELLLQSEQLSALIQGGGLSALDKDELSDVIRRHKRLSDQLERAFERLQRQVVERAVTAALRANATEQRDVVRRRPVVRKVPR